MDIYYPKDTAVSHGKVHELLDPEALKRGEPLTEESIRWLLELHGEMYLIEQHYSTRTRMRRLALNGTPVAEFSDLEPMVDFQLGAANIRMCFTVRGNGVVYELYVNGKRFEDLTQALPSPIAARAEGSGMIFGAPLVSQRLGLLPPHLQPQQPATLLLPAPSSAPHPSPLDSSLSSLTQPISSDAGLGLLDDSYHSVGGSVQQFYQYHHRRRSSQQRISISLGSVHLHGAPPDSTVDIFASLAAASSMVAITPTTTVAATITEQEAPETRREESAAMVVVGREAKGQEVHGAGLLLRPSSGGGEGQCYFSSDDEMEGEGEKASSMHVAAAAVPAGGGNVARRRRRGTKADFLLIEEEEVEGAVAMDTAGANRIVLPAFKAAKTSAGGRPRSLPNLLLEAKQEGHDDGATGAAAVAVEKRQPGLERVLAAEEPGAPLAMQRSLSASDVMGRPPNLRIIPPPPPTAFHRSVSLLQQQRGARQQSSTGGGGGGAVGPRGIQPPVIRPR